MLLCFWLFLAVQFSVDRFGLFYGVAVSLVNLSLSYGFYLRHQKRVAKYQAQALMLVVQSVVFRWGVVCCLLFVGFKKMDLVSDAVLVGFVIGQLFYLVNQLIRVARQHGK